MKSWGWYSMTRDKLTAAVAAAKGETREALQTVYDALNSGQKNKILKNEQVKALFERFGVET